MKHFHIFILSFPLLFLNGCQLIFPENETDPEIALINSPTDLLEAGENSFTFVVSATHSWNAYYNESWIFLSPSSGEAGETEVTLYVEANDTHENRNSFITFNCEDVSEILNIEQMQDDCLELSRDEACVEATGGELFVEVLSNIPYEISIEADAQHWIIPDETRSMSSYLHVFSICSNSTTESREGKIYLTGNKQERVFVVHQEGFAPQISVYENDYYLEKEGGNIEIYVDANCDIEIECPAEWVHCNDDNKDGRYYFSIDPNNEVKARETVISFKNKMYGICEEVHVSQGCDNPFIVVSPSSIDIPASSHTFDVQVESNVDVDVSVNIEWISFIGKNGNIYSFSTKENNTTENNRRALITFTNNEHNVSCQLTVRQENMKIFTPSQESYTINYTAQSLKIDYYSTSYFSVSTNAEWIRTTDSIRTGNHSLTFKIEENNGKETRTADIMISDSTNTYKLIVIQTGKTTNSGGINDMEHIEW